MEKLKKEFNNRNGKTFQAIENSNRYFNLKNELYDEMKNSRLINQ